MMRGFTQSARASGKRLTEQTLRRAIAAHPGSTWVSYTPQPTIVSGIDFAKAVMLDPTLKVKP